MTSKLISSSEFWSLSSQNLTSSWVISVVWLDIDFLICFVTGSQVLKTSWTTVNEWKIGTRQTETKMEWETLVTAALIFPTPTRHDFPKSQSLFHNFWEIFLNPNQLQMFFFPTPSTIILILNSRFQHQQDCIPNVTPSIIRKFPHSRYKASY